MDTTQQSTPLAVPLLVGNENGNKSIHEEPLEEPKEYAYTQFGLVERLLDRYGHNIRWNKAFGYIIFDGKRWVPESEAIVERYIWLTIRFIYADISTLSRIAHACPNENYVKVLNTRIGELTRHVRLSENSNTVTGVSRLAHSHCMLEPDVFAAHEFLFNFQNGTLDLRTGSFYAYRREDYLTMMCPFNYNPHAEKPIFDVFLDDITQGNEGLKYYLQKILGYGLTANNKEDVWFNCVGAGENGKTTLFDAYVYALGEYATRIDEKTISVVTGPRDGAAPSPDIASLKGKRVAIIAETEEGAKVASSRIKDMASGEQVTARKLHRDNFVFRYTHKLFVYTNNILIVRDNSHGFWRRVRFIPFTYQVTPKKKDIGLISKLQQEAEGILAWLVEGERLRQKEGMEPPDAVKKATQDYRESQDLIGQFVREYCITGKDEQVAANIIQSKFKEWLEDMNLKVSMPAFRRMMEDRGYRRKHTMHGELYTGLRMKEEHEYTEEHKHESMRDYTEESKSNEHSLQASLEEYKPADMRDMRENLMFSPIGNGLREKTPENLSYLSYSHTLEENLASHTGTTSNTDNEHANTTKEKSMPFRIGELVETPKGIYPVSRVSLFSRRVAVRVNGYLEQNYPFEQVCKVKSARDESKRG